MKFSKRVFIIGGFLAFSFLFMNSCGKDKSEGFGVDADYFIGLQLLSEGREAEAIKKLNHCAKKGTKICAQKSYELLLQLESVSDKEKLCANLLKTYPDSDSTVLAADYFLSNKNYKKVLEITDNAEVVKGNDSAKRIRLEALNAMEDSRFKTELTDWFLNSPVTKEHSQFYNDVLLEPEIYKWNFQTNFDAFLEAPDFISPEDFLISFRMKIYRKNYSSAFNFSSTMIDFILKNKISVSDQLCSDIGKAFLYGNTSFVENAAYLAQIADELKNTSAEFYFIFYSGRLYEKAKNFSRAASCFEKAFSTTSTSSQKDNALWYLLNSKMKLSYNDALSTYSKYKTEISDFNYFDDLFDTMITSFFSNGRWDCFSVLQENAENYCSKETYARISYLYGRLIEEGMIQVSNSEQVVSNSFIKALDSGKNYYYKILAAKKLNYSDNQLRDILYENPYLPKENAELQSEKQIENKTDIQSEIKNSDAEKLLKGYVHFGFPEKIYSEYQKYEISDETKQILSSYLSKCADDLSVDKYRVQSLRIACRINPAEGKKYTKEQFELIYPQNYSKFVDTYCKKYDIKTSIIYALIRSESFFDASVSSTAGAIGLTQLMEVTASDVARKLKKSTYSLEDPETNIEFGTFYLAELIRRLDGSILRAFFSYNAGITKVRRWLAEGQKGFGQKKDMSGDLFLECLAYEETREYGRKLVSASIIYELLYSDYADTSSLLEGISLCKIL